MWWKIYFGIYTLLTVLGLFGLLEYTPLNIIDILGVVLGAILVAGLYAYIFKKKILQPKQWKILFWVAIAFLVEELLVLYVVPPAVLDTTLSFLQGSVPVTPGDSLFSWILSTPALMALYKLGNKKS